MKKYHGMKGKGVSRGNPEKLYSQLYRIMKGWIESGVWPQGTGIPPEKELCRIYGISLVTVKTAISCLVREGYLERKQGKGTYVRKGENWEKKNKLAEEISHEVNNPLAVIGEKAGWLEDLLKAEDRGKIINYHEFEDALKKIKAYVDKAGKAMHGRTDLPAKIEAIRKK